jgi:hypothetical protein
MDPSREPVAVMHIFIASGTHSPVDSRGLEARILPPRALDNRAVERNSDYTIPLSGHYCTAMSGNLAFFVLLYSSFDYGILGAIGKLPNAF